MTNNIYLFTGDETYLLHEQVANWRRAFKEKHGDTNLEILDADETPLNEIMAATIAGN